MADSIQAKNKQNAFVEDLDAMFDTADADAHQQVGLVDEHDAFDRLLANDSFQQFDQHEFAASSDSSSKVILSGAEGIKDVRSPDRVVEEVDDFFSVNKEHEWVHSIDEVNLPELNALEQVADVDEFTVQTNELARFPSSLQQREAEAETIAEIAAFFEDMPRPTTLEPKEPAAEHIVSPPKTAIDEEMPKAVGQIDFRAELTDLAIQVEALKNQQQVLKQEMAEKADQEELILYRDQLNAFMKTEQKKNKYTTHSGSHPKPVVAYVAIVIALLALLLAGGLGYQVFFAQSQTEGSAQTISQLQEQLNNVTANFNADKDNLQKQLDELKAVDSKITAQIAEINKALEKNSVSAKTNDAFDKKITVLNNHNLQVGAKLEDLQNKVTALKQNNVATITPGAVKIVASADPVVKQEKKTQSTAEENWVVYLISFKQDWFAKRKADEFAGKGISARVSKAESKGENWYRLSVDGFKSRAEASNYAAKVKKTLNLDSVWITSSK